MLLLAASLSACSTTVPSGCSELARGVLTTPTPHAVIGNTGDAALDWQFYGLAETAGLNAANDRAATGYAIIHGCEVRDSVAVKPWYRR